MIEIVGGEAWKNPTVLGPQVIFECPNCGMINMRDKRDIEITDVSDVRKSKIDLTRENCLGCDINPYYAHEAIVKRVAEEMREKVQRAEDQALADATKCPLTDIVKSYVRRVT